MYRRATWNCFGIWLDQDRGVVRVFGEEKNLKASELQILARLTKNQGRTVSYAMICSGLQEAGLSATPVHVQQHIKRIRRKLFKSHTAGMLFIQTIRDEGFRIPSRVQIMERPM